MLTRTCRALVAVGAFSVGLLSIGQAASSSYLSTSTIRSDIAWEKLGPTVSDDIFNLVPEQVFSDAYTDRMTLKLQRGAAECLNLPPEYRIDCLSRKFREVSRSANRPDYRGVRQELGKASRALASLVKENADPQLAPIRKGNNTYRAVKRSAVKTVNRQAVAIIQETETKLLRSATSGLRRTHYQRLARAVGSTKTLFRS